MNDPQIAADAEALGVSYEMMAAARAMVRGFFDDLDVAPRPTPKPAPPAVPPERQRVLFAGLDALPGQRDLFPTDGPAD